MAVPTGATWRTRLTAWRCLSAGLWVCTSAVCARFCLTLVTPRQFSSSWTSPVRWSERRPMTSSETVTRWPSSHSPVISVRVTCTVHFAVGNALQGSRSGCVAQPKQLHLNKKLSYRRGTARCVVSVEIKIELLTFNSKILLHLSCRKNGISSSLTFHESKLHVINLSLLPNSVFKNPFYDFHSSFQQFNPSNPHSIGSLLPF